jgi:hypothetical protein
MPSRIQHPIRGPTPPRDTPTALQIRRPATSATALQIERLPSRALLHIRRPDLRFLNQRSVDPATVPHGPIHLSMPLNGPERAGLARRRGLAER